MFETGKRYYGNSISTSLQQMELEQRTNELLIFLSEKGTLLFFFSSSRSSSAFSRGTQKFVTERSEVLSGL